MKKTGLVLLFLSVTAFTAVSQDRADAFHFGFKIAPNVGWIKPDIEGYSRDGMSAGFSWGFVADYLFSQSYGISSGFTITSNAGKLKYPHLEKDENNDTVILTGTMHRKYKIRSLEIPILLKMKTKEIGYFTYYGLIGFGTSVSLSAKAEDEFSVEDPAQVTITHEPDVKSRMAFLRESLIVGLGAEYNISGNTRLFGGLTFNNGFTNILKGHNTKNTKLAESAISNYIELNLGVYF